MSEPSEPILRFDRVSKRFGSRVALDALSFEVQSGEVLALLGPNGAGKSTAFGLMLGHLRPSAGEVFLHGVAVTRDRRRALRRTGAVPESPAFYEYLTGWANLCGLSSYSGPVDPAELRRAVDFVSLGARIDDPVRTYSRGMCQRLALAQALVPAPDLVLLDEPAEGLDPEGIADMHRLIVRLKHEHGLAVVIASHLLPEVEAVCDRVVVLDAGRLVFEGRWDALDANVARLRLDLDDWERAAPVLEAVRATRVDAEVIAVPAATDVGELVAALVRCGVSVRAVERLRPTLREQYFGRLPERGSG